MQWAKNGSTLQRLRPLLNFSQGIWNPWNSYTVETTMTTARTKRPFVSLVIILAALALSACVVTACRRPLGRSRPAPADAGADSGPIAIVGEAGSANFYASPETFPEPVVALIDASNVIKQEASFASDKTQILGTFDTAMFPLPAKYSINLPIKPAGTPIDLDNNGKTDTGVQVFSLIVASNFTGDSILAATRTGRHGVVSDRYCDR